MGGGAGLRNPCPKPDTQMRAPFPPCDLNHQLGFYPRLRNPVRVSHLSNGAHPVSVNTKDNHGQAATASGTTFPEPGITKIWVGETARVCPKPRKTNMLFVQWVGGCAESRSPPGFPNISVPRVVLVRCFRFLVVLRLGVWAQNPIA